MRRILAYVLLSLGLLFILLAPLAHWYITPRVKKLPLDIYSRDVSVGPGTYLNPGAGFTVVGPVQLTNVHVVKGDIDAGSKTVAVWDSFDSTFDSTNHHQLDYGIDRFTFARATARSVNCCGQNQDRTGSLTLTFPLGVEKHDYPWWDDTAQAAYPMKFSGESTFEGINVWTFKQHIDPVLIRTIQLPEKVLEGGDPNDLVTIGLTWWYTADTQVRVEPVTGAVVSGEQVADQYLEDSSGMRRLTVANTHFAQDRATIEDNASYVRSRLSQLLVVQRYLPTYGPIAGLLMLMVAVLLARVKRTPPRAEVSSAAQPAAA